MEMNTKLEVEHKISDLIMGIDLVKEQIWIAQGESLKQNQDDILFRGYAIQGTILVEYFNGKFILEFEKITKFDMPGGFGVRIYSSYEINNIVITYYDSICVRYVAMIMIKYRQSIEC
ncbi:ATP-binding protein [Zhenhengia yiwuensis]|uniref:biotin carboxylase n=1 Tax=Zhenhengia yiwuensis TaxID=2763666 RepID=A0A926EKK9_9FIRM|nr:hypothetical protein [Zhenhengia yiwuensis]MBC8580765.1 hypothetical protein [Zhenhengia yiwuensis]